MKKILIISLVAFLSACTNSSEAERALRAAGFTKIETKGYAFFGCSDDDKFHTSFEAVGPTGQHVEGVVCSGFIKGATIRFD